MKSGAADYVIKQHLGRLGAAVESALKNAAIEADKETAEQKLVVSERRKRDLIEFAPVGIFQATRSGFFLSANRYLVTLLGYESPEELMNLWIREIDPRVKFVLMTGYMEPDKKSELMQNGIREIVFKPFRPVEVLRKVREILNEPCVQGRGNGSDCTVRDECPRRCCTHNTYTDTISFQPSPGEPIILRDIFGAVAGFSGARAITCDNERGHGPERDVGKNARGSVK